MSFSVKAIQEQLRELEMDGWLLYIFRDSNPVAITTLEMPEGQQRTRRAYYWIPVDGDPIKLQHAIEPHTLEHLPGKDEKYLSYTSLAESIKKVLKGAKTVAMEYSPNCLIPTVSWVDAGTIELVRAAGVDVVSSAELIQYFEAVLTESQIKSHISAATALRDIAHDAFKEVEKSLQTGSPLSEVQVQDFIMRRFDEVGLETDHPPIIGANAHASDPHYSPVAGHDAVIEEGDLLLIDLWAKWKDDPKAIYGDETWMGYVGKEVPEEIQKVWEIVRNARRGGFDFIKSRMDAGEAVYGWEVDDVVRKPIVDAGYGDYFIHRTGHSMTTVDHGNGANIDNLETKELRPLIPNTIFSLEPGVYLKEFGIRSEYDVIISPDGKPYFAEGTDQIDLITMNV